MTIWPKPRQSPLNLIISGDIQLVATVSEIDICQRIRDSVLEQQLAPGTKLTEEALCGIFSVSRGVVRKALTVLANDNIVTLVKNKGAVIASPSTSESHEIFEARTIMENALLRRTIKRADCDAIRRLRAHLAREEKALDEKNVPKWIRLSGEFHVVLGREAQNDPMCEFLEQLVFRSSLILALYGDQGAPTSCKGGEHERIVDAIEAGDLTEATAIMAEHMASLEGLLDFARKEKPRDLASILASAPSGAKT